MFVRYIDILSYGVTFVHDFVASSSSSLSSGVNSRAAVWRMLEDEAEPEVRPVYAIRNFSVRLGKERECEEECESVNHDCSSFRNVSVCAA